MVFSHRISPIASQYIKYFEQFYYHTLTKPITPIVFQICGTPGHVER